uniref:Putative anthocyanin acyltransferase n=1 Tax=Lobelia erinus TaxID=16430 RepID=B0I1H6_LOBER|nr:putative anthocyanin acyltransferase [Lobelia erinus]
MSAGGDLTVLEHSQISPASAVSATENSFPLSFLDIPWLMLPPIHQLCFYELPECSQSNFIQTIVPNLKQSLSITLQHFFPLAGNLIVFPYTDPNTIPRKPEIRYVEGDSVSVTIAESTKDFDYLTGNQARKADEFYPLVPKLGDITKSSDSIKVPLLAIQLTLFAGHGFCIGLTNHHTACDGNARVNFIKSWALISKFGNDELFLASGSLPFFDRTIINDPNGLDAILWSQVATTRVPENQPQHISGNADEVRATFIMTRDEISRIKKSICVKAPTLTHVSTFTIVCAIVWTSLVKVRNAIGENKDDDDREVFGCAADCMARTDPPLPATYFGNCITGCVAPAKRDQLLGEEGFLNAVRLIGYGIHERFKNKNSVFAGAEFWMQDIKSYPPTAIGVAGSPKFSLYDTDFGWGNPKKCEIVSIDYSGSISLSSSRDSKEDIEIGLSLPKIQMDVFETIFSNELRSVLVEDQ